MMLEPGPYTKFSEYDMVKTLLELEKRPLGRDQLTRVLKLGEGSTRSLMKKLKKSNLVKTTTRGITLTSKGSNFLKKLKNKVYGPVKIENFEEFSVAWKVKNSADKVKVGIEQRDAAIRADASGILVFTYFDDLKMPGAEHCLKGNNELCKELKENFKLSRGDVIVLAFASVLKKAEEGAWAALKTLIESKDL